MTICSVVFYDRGWAQKFWVLKRKNELKLEKSNCKENGTGKKRNLQTRRQTFVLSGLRLAKELVKLLDYSLSALDQPSPGLKPAFATTGNNASLCKPLTLHLACVNRMPRTTVTA